MKSSASMYESPSSQSFRRTRMNRVGIANLPLLIILLPIHQKSQEPFSGK